MWLVFFMMTANIFNLLIIGSKMSVRTSPINFTHPVYLLQVISNWLLIIWNVYFPYSFMNGFIDPYSFILIIICLFVCRYITTVPFIYRWNYKLGTRRVWYNLCMYRKRLWKLYNIFYNQYFKLNPGGLTFCCLQTRPLLRRVSIKSVNAGTFTLLN